MRIARVWWVVLMMAFVTRAAAQAGYPPTIIEFASTVTSVRLTALEAGGVNTVLSWHAVNMTASASLQIDVYLENIWTPIVLPFDPIPASGSTPYTIQHPRGFAPPTYRLRLYDGDQLVDERVLVIPYDSPANMARFTASSTPEQFTREGLPSITRFELLPGGSPETPIIGWSIADRAPNSNPIIEQVIGDQAALVEPPRPLVWMPSDGTLTLQNITILPEGITLRLRIVDLLTGVIYDEAVITAAPSGTAFAPTPSPSASLLPVTPTHVIPGGVLDVITLTPDAAAPTLPAPPTLPVTPTATIPLALPRIVEFRAAPAELTPGGTTRLIWIVEDALAVEIQEITESGAPGLLYIQLPHSGTLQITLAAGVNQVSFNLIARNANGETVERMITVAAG